MGEGFTFTEEQQLAYIADGTAPLYKPGMFGTGQYPLVEWGLSDPSKTTAWMSWSIFRNYERYTLREDKRYGKASKRLGVCRRALLPSSKTTAVGNGPERRVSSRCRGVSLCAELVPTSYSPRQ
jgi:hypothetical protein